MSAEKAVHDIQQFVYNNKEIDDTDDEDDLDDLNRN